MELNTWVVLNEDVRISEIENQVGTGSTHTGPNLHLLYAEF